MLRYRGQIVEYLKMYKGICLHLSGALGSVFYVAPELFVLIECDNKVE